MAVAEQIEDKSRSEGGIKHQLIWFLAIAAALLGGFLVPLILVRTFMDLPEKNQPQVVRLDTAEQVDFIDFPEIIAVLGKSKFTRYLRLKVALQVPVSSKATVEKQIAARSAVIRNRVINHVAELTEESISGQHGNNQLRRYLHNVFNEILFDDGIERIQEVLFKEFQVQ